MATNVKSDGDVGKDNAFSPDESLIQQLLGLGISRNAAVKVRCSLVFLLIFPWHEAVIIYRIFKGLYYTGNHNAEFAAAWVFDQEGSPSLNDPIWVSLEL